MEAPETSQPQELRRRTLVIVRHAKSAWPAGVPDRERPLAPRGQADAPVMGTWIAKNVGPVGPVVLSPAVRVDQTWSLLGARLDHGDVAVDPRVYQAWGSHLLDVVRELPDEAEVALIVGHEPGVSELALTLSDHQNHVLRRRISHKYPTCAVAVLDCHRPWSRFGLGCAQLRDFVAPRDF